MTEIRTPSALYEIRRYQDTEVGTIMEMVPLDPLASKWYLGDVLVTGETTIRFRLKGTTLGEALADWEPALRKVLDDLETRSREEAERAEAERVRALILSNGAGVPQ